MSCPRFQLSATLLAAFVASVVGAFAQQPAGETLSFHFERAALPVPEYTVTLHQDGSGTYTASYTAQPPASKYAPTYPVATAAPAVPTTRPITLSPKTTAQLFERARNADGFRVCESKVKNIADTGAKTITYSGPQGSGKCTFNYTEIKTIAGIAETFQGIAETLDEGRTLDLKHRYDRLGLDREMGILVDNVKEGHALEVGTIAAVLQSICDDMQVMERVRKRAAGLLQASANAR